MKQSYVKYILSLLLFGSNGIVASYISLSSYDIVLLRTMLGSMFLLTIFCLSHRKITLFKYTKQLICLILSGIALGGGWIFLYEAYQLIGVSISSLLYYCGPVIVMILSPFIFKEKLTAAKLTGFFTVLVGIYLINTKSSGVSINGLGLFCGGMSAIMYSAMVIFSKMSKDIQGLENSMIQLISAFLTTLIFVVFKHGLVFNITPGNYLPIIFLGFINTGIGCYLYFSSISNLPVHSVSICGYLEPLSAVMFSALFLHEKLSIIQLIGVTLVLGGAISGELFKLNLKCMLSHINLKYSPH